jgi:hypothetical protein
LVWISRQREWLFSAYRGYVGKNLVSHRQNLNRARRTFDTYTFAVRTLNGFGKRFRTLIPRRTQIPSAARAACRMSVDDMSVNGT